MMGTRDPLDRLSSAYRVEVDPGTKERHLAEMGAAIRSAPPVAVPAAFGLRRRIAAAAAAVFIVAPAGIALASESTVPGDFLYPVKEITERVRSFIDHDIEATHRVEEAERLIFRRAPVHTIARAVERAESATVQLAEPGDLKTRLERTREYLQQQDEERQIAEGEGSTDGQKGAGSGSDEPRRAEESGTTTSPGAQGPAGREGEESPATSTTSDQGQSESGESGAAGSMTGPGSSSSTSTAPGHKEP